jgi:hydrogenase-4 membrane subunit HyfE
MTSTVVVLLTAIVAIVARTLIPYLQTLRDNPETQFDRKFLVPPIISCIIALLTLPISLSALPPELLNPSAPSLALLVAVFVAVWGVTDVVRTVQKLALG